jgi:hypothetical protein
MNHVALPVSSKVAEQGNTEVQTQRLSAHRGLRCDVSQAVKLTARCVLLGPEVHVLVAEAQGVHASLDAAAAGRHGFAISVQCVWWTRQHHTFELLQRGRHTAAADIDSRAGTVLVAAAALNRLTVFDTSMICGVVTFGRLHHMHRHAERPRWKSCTPSYRA